MTRLAAIALVLACMSVPSLAQEAPSEEMTMFEQNIAEDLALKVVEVMRGARPAGEVFGETFLASVPPEMFAQVTAQMEAQFGPVAGVASVEVTGPGVARIAIRFEKAVASGPMRWSNGAEPRIVGLLLNDFQPLMQSEETLESDLEALPGDVGVLFAPLDGRPAILARNAEQQFAIGSTFKLYVLSALAQQIARGEREWSDVVTLNTRSLPSGLTQGWPLGSPVTLHTLATLMISISDNTATEQLIRVLGRETIAEEVRATHSDPDRILPFLTTRELFALKGDQTRGSAYGAADEAGQARLLEELGQEIGADSRLSLPDFSSPNAIGTLEWFASPDDIRKLLSRIVALDDPTAREILAINPSLSESRLAKWAYAGFKGGSEPGVLNLTWLLQDEDGEWRVLTMSWNDRERPLSKPQFELLAQRVLALEP